MQIKILTLLSISVLSDKIFMLNTDHRHFVILMQIKKGWKTFRGLAFIEHFNLLTIIHYIN